jgi:L-threonylcarbamoyladenylate synthase
MIIVKQNKKSLEKACAILKKGGVVVYPTDTAYAMGGIFNSKKVTEKILKIKKRKDEKFTVIACSFKQADDFFKLNFLQKKLAKKYWPGPLSIVVSKRFAVRVPKEKISITLSRLVGKPLIATSANISGQETLYNSKDIIKQFKDKKNQPDLMVDCKRLEKNKTSTIVLCKGDRVEVLRPGSVKI